jgi:hypothetical protein
MNSVEPVEVVNGQILRRSVATLLHLATLQDPEECELRWVIETKELYMFSHGIWCKECSWVTEILK